MATIIILEALDKNAKVQHRHFIQSLPYYVGRGYSNDLVLDDDFISPEHIKIDLDVEGNLVTSDMGSTNGLYLFNNSQRVSSTIAKTGTEIRIGHTRLRFRKPDYLVKEALKDSLHDHLLSRVMNKRWLLVLLWVAVLSVIAIDQYIGNFNQYSIAKLLSQLLFDYIVVAVWVAGWVVANRLTTNATNFGAHLFVAGLGYASLVLLDGFSHYISYVFSMAEQRLWLEYGTTLLVISAVFYGHLRYCSLAMPKRVVATAAGVSLSVVSLMWFQDAVDDSFSNTIDLTVRLKPPVFNVVVSDQLSEFFASSATLKEQVDQETTRGRDSK
ncbi:MAG: FHA domain-containing protein [Methylococcales bacterium]|nr:FHA domain-containing protein [Methylococcales bacterium]MBT7443343.1 FHA domain-containing protein [Methylococcales bacterium]